MKSLVLVDIIQGFFLLYSSFKFVCKFKFCVSPVRWGKCGLVIQLGCVIMATKFGKELGSDENSLSYDTRVKANHYGKNSGL